MKYENIDILGTYTLENGGTINFSMGNNIKFNSEVATYIHELAHMYLTNSTNIGFLMLLIKFEHDMAIENDDEIHAKKIKLTLELIFNRTINVQEVFANNIELLWAENNVGKDYKEQLYNAKTPIYKEYCNKLDFISNNSTLDYEEKKIITEKLCMHALNISIISSNFLNSLNSLSKLKEFFAENSLDIRLNLAIDEYQKYGKLPNISNFSIEDLLHKLKSKNILKHTSGIFPSPYSISKIFMSNGEIDLNKINTFLDSYQQQMEERIKLFNISNLKVLRINNFTNYLEQGLYIIKNSENLYQKENFYAISQTHLNGDIDYISDEISLNTINTSNKLKFLVISSYEYDSKRMEPKYILSPLPVIILVEDYTEAKELIKNIYINGELIIGDLYQSDISNFSTMIFFKERTRPNQIFIFPTIKKIGQRLISELKIERHIIYSDEDEFKKILSVFKNESEMLEFIKWIFSFIMNSSSNFIDTDNPVMKMSFGIVKSLLDKLLVIKNGVHFELMGALPSERTKANPYYALMVFNDKHRNTGKFFVMGNNIILFSSKSLAHKFNKQTRDKNLKVVGLDKFYWNILKIIMKNSNYNFALCSDPKLKNALVIDFEKLDSIITNSKN